MPKALPKKLGKEPLIEAVCELRVTALAALHSVLPGYLFAKFPNEIAGLEQLPAGQIPEIIRNQDPALAFAPAVRMDWRGYLILVGPRNVSLSCRRPYPGWESFKGDVLQLFRDLLNSGLVKAVNRYSLRYVNFFPASAGAEGQISMMDWDLKIGGKKMTTDRVQVRIELSDSKFVTVLTIVSPAMVDASDLPQRNGGVVDVDTSTSHDTDRLEIFSTELETRLDAMRVVNKEAFFDSLTDEAISLMEPVYE